MVRVVAGPMLAVSLLWLSTLLWPTGLTANWTYVPSLQANAFVAAITAVFAIGLFKSKLRALIFALIAVLAVVLAPRIPAPFLPDANAETLRILSLNTYFGKAEDGAIADRILELGPDVVILSETNHQEVRAVTGRTGFVPTGEIRPEKHGAGAVVILVPKESAARGNGAAPGGEAQQPGAEDTVQGVGAEASGGQQTGPEFGGKSRDLGLTEFQMPMIEGRVGGGVENEGQGEEDQATPFRIVGAHLLTPIGDDRLQWDQQLESLGNWVDERSAAGEGLIIAGDFNATRAHPRFRELGVKDCTGHMAHTPTWPSQLPVLRLDHVLTNGTCHDGGQFDVPGTDHRGIWADVTPLPVQ